MATRAAAIAGCRFIVLSLVGPGGSATGAIGARHSNLGARTARHPRGIPAAGRPRRRPVPFPEELKRTLTWIMRGPIAWP
jgi:hypothetical protein